jgi:GNAT superfamily N-acetyltransferase
MFDTCILRDAADKALLRHQDLDDAFQFFDRERIPHRTYVAVLEEGRVVGLAALLESSGRHPGALGVGFIETHAHHRQRGIGKLLVEGLFQFARQEGKAIANTEYEPDGERYLKHLMAAAAQRYPDVTLFER